MSPANIIRLLRGWIVLLVLTIPLAASAAAPAQLPVQGFLANGDEQPVDGEVSVTLALYDTASGGTALFAETQIIEVDDGYFSLMLGSVEELDLELFRDHGELYLGMKAGDDPEMSPRLALGSVPYAGFAQYAGDAQTLEGQRADTFRKADETVSWSELDGVPEAVSDGDDDTLAALPCGEGEVAKMVSGAWTCTADEDTTLSETDVDDFVSDNGYALATDLATVATSGSFDDLSNVPAGLDNGDDDTLAGLPCGEGEVAKVVSGAWTCAADKDEDTTLSDADVVNAATNHGFALSSDLSTVATSGSFNDLSDVPAGLGNGDDDTLAALPCGEGQVAKMVGGSWQCGTDTDTTYDGSNFALSNRACQSGEFQVGTDATGEAICRDHIPGVIRVSSIELRGTVDTTAGERSMRLDRTDLITFRNYPGLAMAVVNRSDHSTPETVNSVGVRRNFDVNDASVGESQWQAFFDAVAVLDPVEHIVLLASKGPINRFIDVPINGGQTPIEALADLGAAQDVAEMESSDALAFVGRPGLGGGPGQTMILDDVSPNTGVSELTTLMLDGNPVGGGSGAGTQQATKSYVDRYSPSAPANKEPWNMSSSGSYTVPAGKALVITAVTAEQFYPLVLGNPDTGVQNWVHVRNRSNGSWALERIRTYVPEGWNINLNPPAAASGYLTASPEGQPVQSPCGASNSPYTVPGDKTLVITHLQGRGSDNSVWVDLPGGTEQYWTMDSSNYHHVERTELYVPAGSIVYHNGWDGTRCELANWSGYLVDG